MVYDVACVAVWVVPVVSVVVPVVVSVMVPVVVPVGNASGGVTSGHGIPSAEFPVVAPDVPVALVAVALSFAVAVLPPVVLAPFAVVVVPFAVTVLPPVAATVVPVMPVPFVAEPAVCAEPLAVRALSFSASGIFCWVKSAMTCLAATCISSILSESFMVVMPMTQSTVNMAAAAIFIRSKCFIICLFFFL